MTNRFLNNRKSCSKFYAWFLVLMLAADVCLADHTQNILLTGYWPPTNEMLRKFSTDPNQNPGGWQGHNWEGRGYDVYAYFPEFPGGTGSNPKGNGDFEIDYQDVGSWQPPAAPTGDFWRITGLVHPVAIMSYGQGDGPWEMEFNARNLPSSSWSADYLSPTKPTPAPPDTTQSSGYVRHSTLSVEAIAAAVNSSGAGINAWIDWDGNPGAFLCEYMAYHDGWYQSIHGDPGDPYYCVAAGFTHLAASVSPSNGTTAVEAALRALIGQLDSQLIQYNISGTVTSGGSPLAGVTMCGLPGNPVTNSSGVYTAQVSGGWSGMVTPLKSGYAFTQKTYSNIRANQSAQDYTASVATADTIAFDAASSASSATAGTTLSWSHTVGNSNNRVLVVGVVTKDSTAADQIISSVKFNGVNMTAVPGSTKSRVVYSGTAYSSTLRTDLYYMLNPPVGTYTVLITYNGSVSYRVGGAVSLTNVKQQAPEAVVANAATATAISTALTVPNSGAWIVDVAGHSNSGTFTTSTSTERWDKNSGNNTGACSTRAVTTPGSNTTTWTYSGSSGTIIHSLAAFAPSETVSVPPTRTLSVSASAGGTVTQPGTGTFNYPDGNIVNLVASASANYHFVNWTGKVADANSAGTTITMDANYTIQANFGINQFVIHASSVAGGSIAPSGDITKDYSSSQLFTATPATGYTVDKWQVDGIDVQTGGTTYTLSNITATHTVSVSFKILTYTVTASAGSNGSINPTGAMTKDYGSSQLFTATANTGYTVDKWQVDGANVQTGGTTYTLSNITATHTVAVSFKIITYTVTASAGTNGSINPLSAVVNYNGSQLFIATPDTGYEVNEWLVDGSGVQTSGTTYTLSNITTTHTVAVTFNRIIFSISGYAVELDGNTPVKDVLMSAGDINTLTDANGYYELSFGYGWSGVIIPAKEGYVFEPNSLPYADVNNDYNDMNYTATLMTFKIVGYVLDSGNATPISDVNVSADNGGGPWTSKYGGGTTIADVNGYYEVIVDYNWSGKVTPTKYAYAFEPNSRSYEDINSDWINQEYIATLLTFEISGCIINECNIPIAGVMVSADNGGGQAITDANGFYEVWVSYAWTGTVTPTKKHFTFEPGNGSYAGVLVDQAGQNYTANNIYDLDGDGSIGLGDIGVMAENWLIADPQIKCDFVPDEIVNFLDFAELSAVW